MKYNPEVVIDYYREVGIELTTEYRFTPTRDYRFDFVHLPSKVALEVQGGVWLPRGGHTSGAGYTKDIEKENLALQLGYRVMKCVPADVCMADTRDTFLKIVEVASGKRRTKRTTDE